MKNTIYEMKNSLDGISSRLDTKKRSLNLKTQQQKLSKLKYTEKKDWKKKMNRDAATCRKISSGLT